MRICDDLKYVGEDNRFQLYGDTPWHCTSFAQNFSDGESRYVVQQPLYHEGIFMGYTNLDVYILTEDELVSNFKMIKEDGSLEPLVHSRDNKELQAELKRTRDYFKNLSDEDFKKLLE